MRFENIEEETENIPLQVLQESEDCDGHATSLILELFRVNLDVRFDLLFSWKTQTRPSCSFLAEADKFSFKISCYFTIVHDAMYPYKTPSFFGGKTDKQPQTHHKLFTTLTTQRGSAFVLLQTHLECLLSRHSIFVSSNHRSQFQ